MTHRVRQSGFALLMALVLVLIAGAVLAGTARRSMVDALEAKGAAEELQRRWAATSCRATLLSRVGDLLDEAEKSETGAAQDAAAPAARTQALAELRITCRLAGHDYLLVLTDEHTRVNVNQMRPTSPAELEASLVRFLRDACEDRFDRDRIHLRPTVKRKNESTTKVAYGSFGQVFDKVSPDELLGSEREPGFASLVTCWGDGKLNLHRASPAVIRQVCEPQLGSAAVDAILTARMRDPISPATGVIAGVKDLNHEQKTKATQMFTDKSTCFSLWVIARGRQRSWHTLAVGVKVPAPAGTSSPKAGGGAEFTKLAEFAW